MTDGTDATVDAPLPPVPTHSGEVIERLLRAARLHLGLEVAFLSEISNGRRVFRHVDAEDPDAVGFGPGDSDPVDLSFCQRVIDGRLPEVVLDAGRLPLHVLPPSLRPPAHMPVGAHVSVPVRMSDGQVYGTFCCFSTRPAVSVTDRDHAVIVMLAALAADCVEAELDSMRAREAIVERIAAAVRVPGFLSIAYQPIIALDDHRLFGVEALARFPSNFGVSPDRWFADATAIGMGGAIEDRAIRSALDDLADLPEGAYLAVNASPAALLSGHVERAFRAHDLDQVVLELTEHAEVHDYDAVVDALRPMRARGLRVAVDDAGAGYASFRHILSIRPEIIKLDISITRELHTDPARFALARALIRFAAEMGAAVVAEGVEVVEELDALRVLGATAAQGYRLGAPTTFAEAVAGFTRHVA